MKRSRLPYRTLDLEKQNNDDVGVLPISSEVAKIRRKLSRKTAVDKVQWLDTGFPYLNAVMGSENYGIPFGRVSEISGEEGHGKTALALELAGMAQQNNGAVVTLYDAESTFDPVWATARGLDINENFHLIQPYMVKEDGKGGTRRRLLDSGELFEEIEELSALIYEKNYNRPQVLIVDSIAAMIAPEEAAKHVHKQTMRENLALSRFLSPLFRRWTPIVRNHNVMMLCINQLREKPTAFGDPLYTPGGRSLRFYSTVRVRMARVKGGKVLSTTGKPIGAKGVITNFKNKAGHGSIEGHKCGFRIFFSMLKKPSQYIDASEFKRGQ